jgi:heme exporter protein B
VGLVAAALTARLKRSGILLALIVMPLYLPLLIFGSGAVEAVRLGESPRGALLLLAAQSVLLATLAPLAAAAALRIGSDNAP